MVKTSLVLSIFAVYPRDERLADLRFPENSWEDIEQLVNTIALGGYYWWKEKKYHKIRLILLCTSNIKRAKEVRVPKEMFVRISRGQYRAILYQRKPEKPTQPPNHPTDLYHTVIDNTDTCIKRIREIKKARRSVTTSYLNPILVALCGIRMGRGDDYNFMGRVWIEWKKRGFVKIKKSGNSVLVYMKGGKKKTNKKR